MTFLFTDIEASTRLLHALGPEAYAEALGEHRRALRDAFAAHGGVEVDTQGDAFFVAFPTAGGALAAAGQGQAALAAGPISVRMGVHTGTPTVTAEGYVGVDVHRGARVAAVAHGGQVLVSETTAALVEAALTDLGRHRLKDFDGPALLLQLGSTTFPPLRTPGAVVLPTPATRFVGRDQELFDAVALVLEHDPAVLTILGPGGIGKTRFVLELARLLAEDAVGGTLFVPLASMRDPTLVLPGLAAAVGAESPEPQAIAARIGEKRTHLVLDNVEQLLPAAARALASLVDAAPSLRLLVSSREALQIAAETRFDLPPLSADDAVDLFLLRARAVRPGVVGDRSVEALCERLDRLPLAIELAAARTRLLTPEVLFERLSGRLDLPATRDADPRQATLRATIEWSYDLLTAREQGLFARLAVFGSGCSLESAEEVCDADLETLASLIDKSLVRRRVEPGGRDRYWMLETIREFAEGRLSTAPALERELGSRHARCMLRLARAAHLNPSKDLAQGLRQDYELVLAERDEMRKAVDWAMARDPHLATEIVLALEQYWATSAPGEGSAYVHGLLQSPNVASPELRAPLLRLQGAMMLLTGAVEPGEASYREALVLFEDLGDVSSAVGLRARFAVHAGAFADVSEARRLVAEVCAANASVGNPIVKPQMLSTLGEIARREGELHEARTLFRDSVDAARESGFLLWELWQLYAQLEVELALDLLDEAERTGQDALRLAWRLEDRRMVEALLVELALAALRRNDHARAGMLWGAVLAIHREEPLADWDRLPSVTELDVCSDERFLAAVQGGELLSVASAVAVALGESQTVP